MLSALQYDVGCLERELDHLDAWEREKGDLKARLVSTENDNLFMEKTQFPNEFQQRFERTRPVVLEKLKKKLLEYGE